MEWVFPETKTLISLCCLFMYAFTCYVFYLCAYVDLCHVLTIIYLANLGHISSKSYISIHHGCHLARGATSGISLVARGPAAVAS